MDHIRQNRKTGKISEDVQVHSVEEVLSIISDDDHSTKNIYKVECKNEIIDEELEPKQIETVSATLEEIIFPCFNESVIMENIEEIHLGRKIYYHGKLSESESEYSIASEKGNKIMLESVSVILGDEKSFKCDRERIKHRLVDGESVTCVSLDDEKHRNEKEITVGVLNNVKNNVSGLINKISYEFMDTLAIASALLFIFWIVWEIFSISADYTKKVTSKRYTNTT